VTHHQVSKKILLPLLASIMAVSPLAIDLYLPAMPQIASELSTGMPQLQNTLSIYLVGYASGLLFFGPLADKYPRRNLVLIGLIGFIFTTLALLFSQSIEMFTSLRFFQAFISSAATVVVPGTIKEIYQKNTAKGLSYVSMIMMVAPMIAPAIGSAILVLHSWQAIFVALALYVFGVLAFVSWQLPNARTIKNNTQIKFLERYKIVFSHREARFDLIASMMISLAFFAYITAIPFVYLKVFNVSEFVFSLLFGLTVFALMIAHFINSKLVVRKGSKRMLGYGIFVAVLFSSLLVTVNTLGLSIGYTLFAVLPLMGSISIIAVNADALVLQHFSEQTGTATAVIGVLRFGVGGLAGPILAYFHNESAMPFSVLMWVSVLVVLFVQIPRLINNNNV